MVKTVGFGGNAAKGPITPNRVVGFILIAMLAAAMGAVALRQGAQAADGRTALVHDADGSVTELPLGQDARVAISTSAGDNVVAVADGRVHMESADCENGDCLRQGWISEPGSQIICLPHGLWIEVVESPEEAGAMDVAAASFVGDGPDAVAVDVLSR